MKMKWRDFIKFPETHMRFPALPEGDGLGWWPVIVAFVSLLVALAACLESL